VIRQLDTWADAHALRAVPGLILVLVLSIWATSRWFDRLERRPERQHVAAEGRRVRALGLDLTDREHAVLAHLERRHWWRLPR
jgi:hypothetical protein